MKCNLCHDENPDLLYSFNNYSIYQCKICQLIFTDPESIKEEDKESMYEEEYYTKVHSQFFSDCWKDYTKYLKKSPKLKRFKNGISMLKRFKKSGKILDIGCATGVFLDMAQKSGYDAYGVEVSKFASDYAKKNFKLKVYNGYLEDSKFKDKSFDVITMWDLIEHVPDPSALLKQSNRLLKEGGIIFILTINENSLMSKMAHMLYKLSKGKIKNPAKLVHPIHHLYHFSNHSLTKMLEKEGFKVIYKKKSEMPLSNIEGSFLTRACAALLYGVSIPLNWQHEISVIAVKK